MKFANIGIVLSAVVVVLSGCAVKDARPDVGVGMAYVSDIRQNADGTYLAAAEASPLRGRVGGAQALVAKEATEKCRSLGKSLKVIKDETESHLWVNGVARMTFACV